MSDAGPTPAASHTAGEGEGRAQRASRYDPRRARARLALIEQQVRLASAIRNREEIFARQPAPTAPGDPWEVARTTAERAISDAERWVKELTPLVGNPERVVDEQGQLPPERRERLLGEFAAKFNAEVSGLRNRPSEQATRRALPAPGAGRFRTRIR